MAHDGSAIDWRKLTIGMLGGDRREQEIARRAAMTGARVRAHGFPHSLLSDRDPRFTGHFWRAFWAMAGTTLSMSTAYHPQTDGQTERANRTLEQMLRSYLRPDRADWAERLWHAELAVNSAVQASTGRSPFSLVHGREPNMPLDLALGPLRAGATPCPAATEMMQQQRKSWADAAGDCRAC